LLTTLLHNRLLDLNSKQDHVKRKEKSHENLNQRQGRGKAAVWIRRAVDHNLMPVGGSSSRPLAAFNI
jgi:hypothetical protein